MTWLWLGVASILQIPWMFSLKFADGFRKKGPTIAYLVFGFLSAYFLSRSINPELPAAIPMAIAYPIWMGTGIFGTVVIEVLYFKESFNFMKLVCILLILAGMAGLKWTSQDERQKSQAVKIGHSKVT